MLALLGFGLYFFATAIVMIVAGVRGRSRMAFGGLTLLGGFLMVQFTRVNGASEWEASLAAFVIPVLTLIAASVVTNGKELAASKGVHGDYKTCQYCAEPIRKDAIKCKHCSSELTTQPSTDGAKA